MSGRQQKPEAVYRTCECGSGQFNLVGFRNATFLVCCGCDRRPFYSSQKGHLGRRAMPEPDVAAFKRALEEP